MHVVFLQGMPSPFFSRIGAKLSALGCNVTGINLCAGDAVFWQAGAKVNYRGTLTNWPSFISAFFKANQVTDLVLLGEQRDYHKQAITIAKEQNIRVLVTDFGYLRPDWITLEEDGMSANSKFPRDPAEIAKIAATVPKADLDIKYRDSISAMAKGDLIYSFSNVLLWWLYPHYRPTIKRAHPVIYFPAIGLRLLFAKSRHKKADRHMQDLIAKKTRYYMFPLQLEHDFQIIAYSPFERIEDTLELTIKSFAKNSPTDMRLVFKIHPWDPGFTNWHKKIKQLAKIYKVAERVDYVEGGNLAEMIKGAIGMVTINSTSAIQALQLGCPVLTLGEAIYNVPGLVYQNGIDNYWADPSAPDAALVNNFINAIAETIHIRGVFFSEPGLSRAVEETVICIYEQRTGIAVGDDAQLTRNHLK